MNIFRILDVIPPPEFYEPVISSPVISRQVIYMLSLLIGEFVAFLVTYGVLIAFVKDIEKRDAAFIAFYAELLSLLAGYFVWWLLGLI